MKKCFLIIFIFFSTVSFGQDNEYTALKNNAIILAGNDFFKFYENELNKNIQTENWKSYLNNLRNKIENLYLIDEYDQPVILEGIDAKINFKTIDFHNKKNKKILKHGINAWKIIPMLRGNNYAISIIDFNISYIDNKYQFENGGGTTIVFEYSCVEKKWILVSNKTVAP